MSDWQKLVENKEWSALNDFWRHHASQEVCAEILEALRHLVPVFERTNGTESRFEHALPREVPPDLAGAAQILCLGELEATALDDDFITTYLTQWNELFPQVQKSCAELAALPEVTDGAADMSRAHHAKKASELLAFIPAILEAMLYPGDAEDEEPDELGTPLQEHVAMAAVYAFTAGRHFQLAIGKEHELDALRGGKVLKSARKAAEQTNALHAAQRERRLARMAELVPHLGPSQAARNCEREGLGAVSAILSQWHRHQK
ncbi:hypothetical protein [Paracoccus laeviglucosivorans]|uniref:Uncharacterized protein n=1 Tax=Paracoccus laeviglucosivorans TaxID=1197861 RepID=A0A521DD18_9RHOB|nr:hypothetical protein [Paracoccus laeviglucosivorans]SMO69569.1 hypothetical protein SAMN06265221_107119 [Paracoccus laeviglucosivorans]